VEVVLRKRNSQPVLVHWCGGIFMIAGAISPCVMVEGAAKSPCSRSLWDLICGLGKRLLTTAVFTDIGGLMW